MVLSELRANAWKYTAVVLAVLAVAAALFATFFHLQGRAAAVARDAAIEARDQALTNLDAERRARQVEQQKSADLAVIASDYETEKQRIQEDSERTVADLRAGNLRLRKLWAAERATGELSSAAASAAESDGGADDRAESAASIVRAADECDAQVRGLQAVVKSDREGGEVK